MKLLFLTEKLSSSEVFHEYKAKNPSAYFFAGFFVLDLASRNNSYELDYSDKEGKIMTFSLNEKIIAKPAESLGGGIPKAIKNELKIDIDKMEELALEESKKKGLKINKILAILQNTEGRVVWSLTCMQGLNILKIKIDTETGEVLSSESVNMLNFIKKIKK